MSKTTMTTIDRLPIDALIEKMGPGSHYHYEATGVDYEDSDYDEQIEGLREYFCCNIAL